MQAIGINPRERLRRLADVFVVDLRMQIVTSLYKRPMSAKQFSEEFGGGSLSRAKQNFDRLAESGWLRFERKEGPGGARRGGVEHFYRSTELAFLDAKSWSLLPYSIRVTTSWCLFSRIAKRFRQVLARSLEEEGRKHDLEWVGLLLDQVGYERVVEALNAFFMRLFEEQENSRLRISGSGAELIRADVLLVAFESPLESAQVDPIRLAEIDKEPLIQFTERLAPVIADDLCLRIVTELNRREMSVTQFHRELGGASKGGIRSRFKRLERAGWLKKVNEQTGGRRRGAKEHYYQATRPWMAGGGPWDDPPEPLRSNREWKKFSAFAKRVTKAMEAGTFDSRLDRSVTLSFLDLDETGWANVTAGIESLGTLVLEEQECAKARMGKSGEEPLAATVAWAAFETSAELAKEP